MFPGRSPEKFSGQQSITWKNVLAYAPLYNWKAERMVEMLKKSICRMVKNRRGGLGRTGQEGPVRVSS